MKRYKRLIAFALTLAMLVTPLATVLTPLGSLSLMPEAEAAAVTGITVWADVAGSDTGASDYYQNADVFYINNADDWKVFASIYFGSVNGFSGKTIYLCADITLGEGDGITEIYTVDDFQGAFDGQGHTITIADGAYYGDDDVGYSDLGPDVGLFRNLFDGSSVSNLIIALEGNLYTSTYGLSGTSSNSPSITTYGILVGKMSGTASVTNCAVIPAADSSYARVLFLTNSSVSYSFLGGIVGYMDGSASVSNCFVDIDLYNVADSYATTTVTVGAVAGALATATTRVSNCKVGSEQDAVEIMTWLPSYDVLFTAWDVNARVGGVVGYLYNGGSISNVQANTELYSYTYSFLYYEFLGLYANVTGSNVEAFFSSMSSTCANDALVYNTTSYTFPLAGWIEESASSVSTSYTTSTYTDPTATSTRKTSNYRDASSSATASKMGSAWVDTIAGEPNIASIVEMVGGAADVNPSIDQSDLYNVTLSFDGDVSNADFNVTATFQGEQGVPFDAVLSDDSDYTVTGSIISQDDCDSDDYLVGSTYAFAAAFSGMKDDTNATVTWSATGATLNGTGDDTTFTISSASFTITATYTDAEGTTTASYKGTAANPMPSITISASTYRLTAGQSIALSAVVNNAADDSAADDLTWSVAAVSGGTLASGTQITSDGVLIVDAAQASAVDVTCTYTGNYNGTTRTADSEAKTFSITRLSFYDADVSGLQLYMESQAGPSADSIDRYQTGSITLDSALLRNTSFEFYYNWLPDTVNGQTITYQAADADAITFYDSTQSSETLLRDLVLDGAGVYTIFCTTSTGNTNYFGYVLTVEEFTTATASTPTFYEVFATKKLNTATTTPKSIKQYVVSLSAKDGTSVDATSLEYQLLASDDISLGDFITAPSGTLTSVTSTWNYIISVGDTGDYQYLAVRIAGIDGAYAAGETVIYKLTNDTGNAYVVDGLTREESIKLGDETITSTTTSQEATGTETISSGWVTYASITDGEGNFETINEILGKASSPLKSETVVTVEVSNRPSTANYYLELFSVATSSDLTLGDIVAAPTIHPRAGETIYDDDQITIDIPSDATVYYTTATSASEAKDPDPTTVDPNDPDASTTKAYTAGQAIEFPRNATYFEVRAIAVQEGMANSLVDVVIYNNDNRETPTAPTLQINGVDYEEGTYYNATDVFSFYHPSEEDADINYTIRYTTGPVLTPSATSGNKYDASAEATLEQAVAGDEAVIRAIYIDTDTGLVSEVAEYRIKIVSSLSTPAADKDVTVEIRPEDTLLLTLSEAALAPFEQFNSSVQLTTYEAGVTDNFTGDDNGYPIVVRVENAPSDSAYADVYEGATYVTADITDGASLALPEIRYALTDDADAFATTYSGGKIYTYGVRTAARSYEAWYYDADIKDENYEADHTAMSDSESVTVTKTDDTNSVVYGNGTLYTFIVIDREVKVLHYGSAYYQVGENVTVDVLTSTTNVNVSENAIAVQNVAVVAYYQITYQNPDVITLSGTTGDQVSVTAQLLYEDLDMFTSSDTVTFTYTVRGSVAAPTVYPTTGDEASEIDVGDSIILSCATINSSVFYTTDGTYPEVVWSDDVDGWVAVDGTSTQEFNVKNPYTVPNDDASLITINAIAVSKTDSLENSEIVSFRYRVNELPAAEAPVSNPITSEEDPTTLAAGTSIYLRSDTTGMTIFYTTDGTQPDVSSLKTYVNIRTALQALGATGDESDAITYEDIYGQLWSLRESDYAVDDVIVDGVVTVVGYTVKSVVAAIDGTGATEYSAYSPILMNPASDGRFIINAVAIDAAESRQYSPSAVSTLTFQLAQAAAPTSTVSTSTDSITIVKPGDSIGLMTQTAGATIYFTLDNSVPIVSNSAKQYDSSLSLSELTGTLQYSASEPIVMPSDVSTFLAIRAIASSGTVEVNGVEVQQYANSDESIFIYQLPDEVLSVIATPIGATSTDKDGTSVVKGTEIVLTCATEGAIIFYDLYSSAQEAAAADAPTTTSSQMYTEGNPIVITSETWIRVIAEKDAMISNETLFGYVMAEQIDTPSSSLPSGTVVQNGTLIQLSSDIGEIVYTLDGSDPCDPENSALYYGNSVMLSGDFGATVMIRAYAMADNYTPSDVVSFSYTICAEESYLTSSTTVNSTVQEGATITLITGLSSAEIYYTIDGTTPSVYNNYTTKSNDTRAYSTYEWEASYGTNEGNSITVTGEPGETFTVKAMAVTNGAQGGTVTVFTFQIEEKTASPVASIPSGAITLDGATVTLSGSEGNIFYTTDGTDPTDSSMLYSEPIAITESMVLKIIAYADGKRESDIVSYVYTRAGQAAAPVASVASGEIELGTSITLSSDTANATIYYSTDGTEPTASNYESLTKYTQAIDVRRAVTIKMIAVASGLDPSVSNTVTYTVVEPEILVEEEPAQTDGITSTDRLESRRTYSEQDEGPTYSDIVLVESITQTVLSAQAGTITNGYELVVEVLQAGSDLVNTASSMGYEVVSVYDVSLYYNGEKITSPGEIEIGLPIETNSYNALVTVAKVSSDSTVQSLETRRSGGYGYVMADSLGTYAVMKPESTTAFSSAIAASNLTNNIPLAVAILAALASVVGAGALVMKRRRSSELPEGPTYEDVGSDIDDGYDDYEDE